MTAVACTLCLDPKAVRQLDAKLNLFTCGACDHRFTIKRPEDHEVYEEEYYLEKHTNWFANPNTGLFEWVRRRILAEKGTGPLTLLDVGCGNGDFLKHLAGRHTELELWGIDSLKLSHPGVRFIQGDFFLEPAGRRFDIVCNFMVIEHIQDPIGFVKRLDECLAPDGLMILSTNNEGGMLYTIGRVLRSVGARFVFDRLYSDHHLNHFTNRSLKGLLERHGFEVIHLKNHNYPLAAVDTPPAHGLVKAFYLAAVWGVFRLSELCGNAFLQTLICRKKR